MVLEVPFSASVRLNCFFYVFIYGCSKLCTALKKFFSFETERQKAAGAGKKITPDEMALVMTDVLESKLLRTIFGMTDLNKTPKKWEHDMRKYEAWYKAHGKDYPVNWVMRFDETLHQEGSYYCFTRCPICEFCQREGISELMPALCSTDEVMFRLQHGKLHREHTIANGDGVCDYWIVGDQVNNPI